MKSKEQIWKEIYSFINEYYADSYGVMVTGSFVTENFNASSDIDIIILSNLFRKVYINTYDYHGLKMQAIVFPVFDLESVLIRDLDSGGIYLSQIHKGEIIKDRNNMLLDFKKMAESIYIHGPEPISHNSFNQIRAKITTRLEDLEGNGNYNENLFTLIDLYPLIISLYFRTNLLWPYTGKSASRAIEKSDNAFHQHLISSIENFVITKDKRHIIKFVKDFLTSVGGEMHFFSTQEYEDTCNKDYLVVFISSNTNTSRITNEYKALAHKAKDYINKHTKDVTVFPYYCPDKRVYKSGLYIIIYGDKEKLNTDVLPFVEMFHLDLRNSPFRGLVQFFSYPYNVNPLDVFGNTIIQKEIISLLESLQTCEYDKMVLGYKVLFSMKSMEFFANEETWKAFWEFLYHITDLSDNSMYVPKVLLDYYSRNKRESCKTQMKSFIEKISSCDMELSGIQQKFKTIEKMYDTNNSYIFKFSKEGLVDNMHLKGHVNFCVFLANIVELIFNSLYTNSNEKLLIVYTLINETSSNGTD